MTDHSQSHPTDELDELVAQLLDIGGVLSQIIADMVEFDASHPSAPKEVPIPEMAHRLIRDVIGDVRKAHSKRDVRVAAKIVNQATEAICHNLFGVNVDLLAGDAELN
jgi:hypothetical protein